MQTWPGQAGKGTKPSWGPALGMVAGWSLEGWQCSPRDVPWDRCCPCTHRVASNLDSSLKGEYRVTVEAQDRKPPVHTAQTVLNVSVMPVPLHWACPPPCPALLSPALPVQIFAVDQSYRVRLQFVTTVDKVQANSENIKV